MNGLALLPTGATLDNFANWLIDPSNADGRVSQRAASDYITRINAGLRIVEPSSISNARTFVVRYWRERAKSAGTPTKTGKQLVGAVTLYDHGFDLIAAARARQVRGVRAATLFRNGLILVIAFHSRNAPEPCQHWRSDSLCGFLETAQSMSGSRQKC